MRVKARLNEIRTMKMTDRSAELTSEQRRIKFQVRKTYLLFH